MTVFTITYNEEFMLPYFIAHYRSRFPDCRIVVYDNMSTDRTIEIALQAGCEVISYDTGGKLSDSKYLKIKNTCWKGEKGWVIVADCDELYDIYQADLDFEQQNNSKQITFLVAHGYNMVNMHDNTDLPNIKQGVRARSYDKVYCFFAPHLKEIYYSPGAHGISPVYIEPDYNKYGSWSLRQYHCLHYKYINPDYMIARHAAFAARLSEENITKGWGAHYLYTPEQIRAEFAEARKNAIQIL